MPNLEAVFDSQELRRCIRDLSTIPAICKGCDPQWAADSIAGVVLTMLSADFVYLALPGLSDEPIEVIRNTMGGSAEAIQASLRQARLGQWEQTWVVPDPNDGREIHVCKAPVGLECPAILVAGSKRKAFPSEAEGLLLNIATTIVTLALQRWRTEAAEHRFVSLVEQSPDFIGLASLDGRPLFLNTAGLRLVGLSSPQDLHGLHILDFLVADERTRARDKIWPIVMQSGCWSGEVLFRHFELAKTIPLLVDWFRIDDPRTGRPLNIATVSRDLSAKKQSEAQLRHLNETLERRIAERTSELGRANQQLVREIKQREHADARLQELHRELFHAARLSAAGQMAAALAHEISQPLTAAANSVNAARRVVRNRGYVRVVGEILDETGIEVLRAGEIVRRMRQFFSRGDAERRAEHLPTMIEDASALALAGVAATHIQPHFEFDPRASNVLADRIQIQQVIVNLIRNAFEAMAGAGCRELQVSTALVNANLVEIAIADTGPGISEEIVEHIFEPFVSTKHDGMGLGLSICRSIVEAHAGTLRTEPNPRGGTIFRFTIPLARETGSDDGG